MKMIDGMAMLKINKLHLHLVDDNGWRIEIKKYPKLTEVGAFRADREDLDWNSRKEPVKEKLRVLKSVTSQLLEDKPVYSCHVCGFNGKTLHWQCPGCKRWDTVKPIQGVEGE